MNHFKDKYNSASNSKKYITTLLVDWTVRIRQLDSEFRWHKKILIICSLLLSIFLITFPFISYLFCMIIDFTCKKIGVESIQSGSLLLSIVITAIGILQSSRASLVNKLHSNDRKILTSLGFSERDIFICRLAIPQIVSLAIYSWIILVIVIGIMHHCPPQKLVLIGGIMELSAMISCLMPVLSLLFWNATEGRLFNRLILNIIIMICGGITAGIIIDYAITTWHNTATLVDLLKIRSSSLISIFALMLVFLTVACFLMLACSHLTKKQKNAITSSRHSTTRFKNARLIMLVYPLIESIRAPYRSPFRIFLRVNLYTSAFVWAMFIIRAKRPMVLDIPVSNIALMSCAYILASSFQPFISLLKLGPIRNILYSSDTKTTRINALLILGTCVIGLLLMNWIVPVLIMFTFPYQTPIYLFTFAFIASNAIWFLILAKLKENKNTNYVVFLSTPYQGLASALAFSIVTFGFTQLLNITNNIFLSIALSSIIMVTGVFIICRCITPRFWGT